MVESITETQSPNQLCYGKYLVKYKVYFVISENAYFMAKFTKRNAEVNSCEMQYKKEEV